jgi:hypothetical protein
MDLSFTYNLLTFVIVEPVKAEEDSDPVPLLGTLFSFSEKSSSVILTLVTSVIALPKHDIYIKTETGMLFYPHLLTQSDIPTCIRLGTADSRHEI